MEQNKDFLGGWREAIETGKLADVDETPEPESERYCKVCEGAGSISTGIDEASSTVCRFCEGTGYVLAAAEAPNAEGKP